MIDPVQVTSQYISVGQNTARYTGCENRAGKLYESRQC